MRFLDSHKKMKVWFFAFVFGLMALLPASITRAADVPAIQRNFSGAQEAFTYYLDMVERLDVSTGISKAVFYSGAGNRKAAERYALSEEKMTLEMTPGGKYLDDLKLFEKDSPLTPDLAVKVWSRLSQKYAIQAAGDVFCFVAGARPTGVFTTVELPELKRNRKIGVIYSVSNL